MKANQPLTFRPKLKRTYLFVPRVAGLVTPLSTGIPPLEDAFLWVHGEPHPLRTPTSAWWASLSGLKNVSSGEGVQQWQGSRNRNGWLRGGARISWGRETRVCGCLRRERALPFSHRAREHEYSVPLYMMQRPGSLPIFSNIQVHLGG